MGIFLFIALHPAGKLFDVGEHVRDIEKAIAFKANVDESGLHARKNPAHPTFVDIADQPACLGPFKNNFC